MSKWGITLATIAATLAVLSAMLYRGLLMERAARLELAAELAELRQAGARPRSTGRPMTLDGVPAEPVAATPTAPQSAGPGVPGEALPGRQELERRRQQFKDPELRAAMLDRHRFAIARSYPNLADDLGWTTEQAEQFIELMAQQRLAMDEFSTDLNAQLVPEGGKPTPEQTEEFRRRFADERQRQQDEQEHMLGVDAYAAWQAYVESQAVRNQLRELRVRLAAGTSPLNQDQFDQLVPMLTAEQRRLRAEISALSETMSAAGDTVDPSRLAARRVELLVESQRRSLSTLRPYLDSEQLRQYQALQNAELQQAKNLLRWQRAMRALESPDPGP